MLKLKCHRKFELLKYEEHVVNQLIDSNKTKNREEKIVDVKTMLVMKCACDASKRITGRIRK